MADRTPSQTVGPFFSEALRWKDGERIAPGAPGPRVTLTGRMTDGAGNSIGDALLEAQLASPHGFGRVETARDGTYRLEAPQPSGAAPFLDVVIFARGLLKPLRTRVYFASEDRVRADPALRALGDSPRLKTLIATPAGAAQYRWDIRFQGDGETVFFAY
jgi:protocatechuate 3,4-dioxygenase alpha subunit